MEINQFSEINPVKPENKCLNDPHHLVNEWSETDVRDWLEEKKIHPVIIENIVPSNGQILLQLHEMLATCPEFFYTSLSSNKTIKTRETAAFAIELKNLLKKI